VSELFYQAETADVIMCTRYVFSSTAWHCTVLLLLQVLAPYAVEMR
jgi:thymidylate kinase